MPTTQLSTIADCIAWAESQLKQSNVFFGHGCDNARDEATWATLHVTRMMDHDLPEVLDKPVSDFEVAEVRELIERRVKTRKPLAYLIKQAWFAGRAFFVDERVIVPRSHIGDLIQDGFEPWIQMNQVEQALDLCCGSGCIAAALALAYPKLRVDASDIDNDALEVARVNVERHRLQDRIRIVQSDLFENLRGCQYDLIACNPPYIANSEIEDLPDEFLHEPHQAFAAGEDGLFFIKKILAQAGKFLSDRGYLVVELGDNADALDAAFPQIPFLWLTSRSGDSVVLLFSKQDFNEYQDLLGQL